MQIVIVGAGVAGCVMARKLSQLAGVEVICLERVARDDHSEAGTGLTGSCGAVGRGTHGTGAGNIVAWGYPSLSQRSMRRRH